MPPLLLLARSAAAKPSPPPPATYVCEALALIGPAPTEVTLARRTADTEDVAVWWIRLRAEQLADQLSKPLARPVRAWLADQGEQLTARLVIRRGQPYTVRFYDGDAEYLLTVKAADRSALTLDPRPGLQVMT